MFDFVGRPWWSDLTKKHLKLVHVHHLANPCTDLINFLRETKYFLRETNTVFGDTNNSLGEPNIQSGSSFEPAYNILNNVGLSSCAAGSLTSFSLTRYRVNFCVHISTVTLYLIKGLLYQETERWENVLEKGPRTRKPFAAHSRVVSLFLPHRLWILI